MLGSETSDPVIVAPWAGGRPAGPLWLLALGARLRRGATAFTLVCVLFVAACASFEPLPMEEVPFKARAETETKGDVSVTAAALGPEEAQQAFGAPVMRRGIQPVWLRIENRGEEAYFFAPLAIDPMYFSPLEAAFINHTWFGGSTNDRMDDHFLSNGISSFIGPDSVVEGFVYVTPNLGSKSLNIVLLRRGEAKFFTMLVDVPGLERDYERVDFKSLYAKDEIVEVDEAGLRAALETLPCCVNDKTGENSYDPLNLVIVADGETLLASMARAGWDETETVTGATSWETTRSFLFGSTYKYSPVSPLYVFSRPQDAAFQKARETIDERNHMRLWVTPLRFEGKPVFIGAISRDIGVIFTTSSASFTTHKIDPDLDAERWYLAQDLLRAQALARLGHVKGSKFATVRNQGTTEAPANTYFSDGLRMVLMLSDGLQSFDELKFFPWEVPLQGEARENLMALE